GREIDDGFRPRDRAVPVFRGDDDVAEPIFAAEGEIDLHRLARDLAGGDETLAAIHRADRRVQASDDELLLLTLDRAARTPEARLLELLARRGHVRAPLEPEEDVALARLSPCGRGESEREDGKPAQHRPPERSAEGRCEKSLRCDPRCRDAVL